MKSNSSVPWQHVWITGASSGIGEALAIRLGQIGVQVSVSARSTDKLSELAEKHESITAFPLDIRDGEAVLDTVRLIEQNHGPIDLAVLNAGISDLSDPGAFSPETAQEILDVNYMGVARSLAAVLPGMKQRKGGHLAIVASLAGYRGLPRSSYYAPTKAALINLAECLEPELRNFGIKIQIINPGFVRTQMTAKNRNPMPFLMEVEDAAAAIHRGLLKSKFEICFPWQLAMIVKLSHFVPDWLYFRVMNSVDA